MSRKDFRTKARQRTNYLIRIGALTREAMCYSCLMINEPLQAHHPDYRDPERVEWLCKSCHTKADRAMREAERFAVDMTLNDRPNFAWR